MSCNKLINLLFYVYLLSCWINQAIYYAMK